MLQLLRILHSNSVLKEQKDFCYSLTDFSHKILVLILESTFTDPLSSGISAHWHNPVMLVDYPQLLLFSLINLKNNNMLSLNIISIVVQKFFENISSDASMFTTAIKSNSKHVISISSFVRGQCLCFGSNFDKEIFIHFVNFTKCIFEFNMDESFNSNIRLYSHSLNQYLSNILIIHSSNRGEFLNKFKVLIPLMSANSHILFEKSNTHTDSLKNIMSLIFIHCYIVSNSLCEENSDPNTNKLDNTEIKTLKETFSRLKSIWDIFLVNHLNVIAF
ncbi:hypothetical protein MXB_181 [Myxobolus squamalis]|nr:hypothetical protein MXB_181 [Myxobolus squamalis]